MLVAPWTLRFLFSSPVTLLAVVALTTVASLVGAADPECIYRKIRGLSPHWPNPSSCSSYYRCSSKSTVRSVTCPAGKLYNSKTGKCSNAKRGLCKLSLIAPLADVSEVLEDLVNPVTDLSPISSCRPSMCAPPR